MARNQINQCLSSIKTSIPVLQSQTMAIKSHSIKIFSLSQSKCFMFAESEQCEHPPTHSLIFTLHYEQKTAHPQKVTFSLIAIKIKTGSKGHDLNVGCC